MMRDLFRRDEVGTITFHCLPEYMGVIAPPIRAADFLPDWYKKLPAIDPDVYAVNNPALTIKRCMPFQDAMTEGYILVTPAEITFEVDAAGTSVTHHSEFLKVTRVIDAHPAYQIKGAPRAASRVALKFLMHWVVKTPPGWSTLFIPLINREQPEIEIFSGLVDTDRYDAVVNLPFFLKVTGKTFILPKGTPICQLIPVKRNDFTMVVRAATPDETLAKQRMNSVLDSALGWYRQHIRAKR
jgi:hypothetical protein